jgi:hypothetical protein
MTNEAKQLIAETFLELSRALNTGVIGPRPVIALTGMSCEHGEQELLDGAMATDRANVEVVYIGSVRREGLRCIRVSSEEEAWDVMNAMLDNGEVDFVKWLL